jgi:hypothetical protein
MRSCVIETPERRTPRSLSWPGSRERLGGEQGCRRQGYNRACRPGDRGSAFRRRLEESPDTTGQDAGESQGAKADGKWNRKQTASGISPEMPAVRVKRWGKSPPASRRRGGSLNPVRCKANRARIQAARRWARVAAERDGHLRQNPAYRPATEKALETGLSLLAAGSADRGLGAGYVDSPKLSASHSIAPGVSAQSSAAAFA